MTVGIFGESCTGKSTLAKLLQEKIGGAVWSGKDYLRLAKSEEAAKAAFREKMQSGENVIYVIAEKEQLALLPGDAVRVLVTAELSLILERFAARMRGNLPPPVKAMLERKHGCFDGEFCHVHIRSGEDSAEEAAEKILKFLSY